MKKFCELWGRNVPIEVASDNNSVTLVVPGFDEFLEIQKELFPLSRIHIRNIALDLLESGELFADAGVANMLNGDFFAWYLDDDSSGKVVDDATRSLEQNDPYSRIECPITRECYRYYR